MVQLICGASLARRLLSEGGCIQRGRTLGAGRAFIKSLIINCSRAWHSAWEDKTQPRDQLARPGAVHAVRRGPGARTHPARAARAKLSRPPRSPAPRTQLSGAPRPQTGRGVVGSRGRLSFPGWGAGASGTRMLAEPAVSGAPTGPGPGRGRGRAGVEGSLGGLPLSSRHLPLKAVSPSSAAPLGREREPRVPGSPEKPQHPLQGPRGAAPSAGGKFPTRRGRSRQVREEPAPRSERR